MTQPKINSGITFQIAGPANDAQMRRLLRENPMPAGISLSMEGEPSYFAALAIGGGEHHTIAALENDRVICAGSITVRPRFLNGTPQRVGYLSGLRLDHCSRGRARILLRGYEAFHDLHRQTCGPLLYLTSIFADNSRAIRFLERGLPHMPSYRRVAEFVTLVLQVRSRRCCDTSLVIGGAGAADLPAISTLLNRQNRQFQFAPVWNVQDLQECRELRFKDFCVARRRGGEVVGCAALWDQRAVRQTIVRSYAPALRRLRPMANLGARLLRRPELPAVGQVVRFAFASHIAAAIPEALLPTLQSLEAVAAERGLEYVTVGFDARDPRLQTVRRHLKCRQYRSWLYVVHWEDGSASAQRLIDGIVSPEVALL
jgi:hypothetical protein